MASKVAIIGSLHGCFSDVFGKVAKLQQRQQFAFAIVVGDVFGTGGSEDELDKLLNGSIEVPLPTYFTVGKEPLPDAAIEKIDETLDVSPNIIFLGKRGIQKTAEGIRIVAVGGQLDPNVVAGNSADKYLPLHTEGDVKALHGANSADILISTAWPTSIQNRSAVPLPEGVSRPAGEECLDSLCSALKPRYYFSCTPDFYWEREPFVHPTTDRSTGPATRFISLAPANNTSKAKWIYAFHLDPTSSTEAVNPTPSPFSTPKKRSREDDVQHAPRYHDHYQNGRHSKRRRAAPPPTPAECFFCLSNPNVASHLVTSIGNESYLTTARGPLTEAAAFPDFNSPLHVLIIPLTHAATFETFPEAEVRESTYNEMTRYRSALNEMLTAKSSSTTALGSVTWEISRASGVHVHWQWMPIAADQINKGVVAAAFKIEGKNLGFPPFEDKPVGPSHQGDYFRLRLWDPSIASRAYRDVSASEAEEDQTGKEDRGSETSLVLPLTQEFRFDLQFARRVMAKLLRKDGRMDWHDCLQSEEQEKAEAEAFKLAFKVFDFSME